MLLKRVFAASIIITVLAIAMWCDLRVWQNSYGLHAIYFVGVLISFREFWALCRSTGHQTFSIWGTMSGCGLVVAHFYAMQLMTFHSSVRSDQIAANILMGTLAISILGSFVLTARRHQFQASLGGVAVTAFGMLYIFFLPSFLLRLRHLGEDGLIGGTNWNEFGHQMTVATVVIAKGCDVFALLFGRYLGKHKAFPTLSPGKTVEGVAAGLIGSMLLALLMMWEPIGIFSAPRFTILKVCIIGFCIGAAGIMGDLAESLLKRSAGAKDAGTLVPGYGGALDVIDSIMVAGPVAYFIFSAII